MDGRKLLSSEYQPPSVFTPFLRRFSDEAAHDLRESIALYKEVRSEHARSVWARSDVMERINNHCAEIVDQHVTLPSYRPLMQALDRCQLALIGQEKTIISFPEIDWSRS